MKTIFKDFAEYWSHIKPLSFSQRDTIFNNLSLSEQKRLKKSYMEEGWEDVEMRNILDGLIDNIKDDLNLDIIFIRTKVLSGKSFYIKKAQWDFIYDVFKQFNKRHSYYVIGDIEPEIVNNETILLKKKEYYGQEKNK